MRSLLFALLWPLVLIACGSAAESPAVALGGAGSSGSSAQTGGNSGSAVTPSEAGSSGQADPAGSAGEPSEGGAAGAPTGPEAAGAAGEGGQAGSPSEGPPMPKPGEFWQPCAPTCSGDLQCGPYMRHAGDPAPEMICTFLCVAWEDGIGAGYHPDAALAARCVAAGGVCFDPGGSGAQVCAPALPALPEGSL